MLKNKEVNLKHIEENKKRRLRLADKKSALTLAQEDWLAENKSYNEWVQITLGVKGQQGELHLAEILALWEELRNDTTETVIAST